MKVVSPGTISVLLVQLGSPQRPTSRDIRAFLKKFLGDPRVVDLHPFLWKIILYIFILPWRPSKVAALYQRIWNGENFPLIFHTENFARKVQQFLGTEIKLHHGFLLSSPGLEDFWQQWEGDLQGIEERAEGPKVIVLPQFPQYSEATTASVFDSFSKVLENRVNIPSFEFINQFHRTKVFIDHGRLQVEKSLREWQEEGKEIDCLIFSFHGMPLRRITEKMDLYYKHCQETFLLLKEGLSGITADKIHMTFQSRFGSEDWIQPYTEDFVMNKVRQGVQHIAVYCPSFVVDCLETLVEIGYELNHKTKVLGGEIHLIPCLNDNSQWAQDYAKYIQVLAKGDYEEKSQLYYEIPIPKRGQDKDYIMHSSEKKASSSSASFGNQGKTTLKILFLTLFLDLVGFTIIFPMFPALAKYYLKVDPNNPLLNFLFSTISQLTAESGKEGTFSPIVLFGGILGALYSCLQFLFAPFWGRLSDRIGRRPILIFSMTGMAIGHLLWIFSGSFTLLVISRLVGGVMSGNISTATAVVADITTRENRSKGMAIVGIAFALGFIIGPAIGGILSLWDLSSLYPNWEAYGINPFSVPAGFAFILSAINLVYLITKFKETLPAKTGKVSKTPSTERSANPFYLFKPLPFKGVNLTNIGYFFFLTAFSGMEFTLTFLAVERFGHSSLQNAYMFIFIGLVIVLIQGGLVRRKAAKVGEKKMALMGLFCLIPGLLLIGMAYGKNLLYLGLFFLSVGSAMTIPCLTTLISLYTPSDIQGQVLGVFRSLGALARVLGPIMASLMYWKWGAGPLYNFGAAFLLLPILMVFLLPSPQHTPPEH